jgi:branched-chain amino acid transport system ATP-binding protein
MTFLESRHLTHHFGGVTALDDLDLSIQKGEFVGIIGPNGSGKTTLFNCLSGFIRPSSGSVFWNGENITGRPMHRVARSGLIRTFQQPLVFPSASVHENVSMACLIEARMRRDEPWQLPQTDTEIIEFVGLERVADQGSASLPAGQLRQLGLAMALAAHPKLILLDEPAAGLNSVESGVLGKLLRQILTAGVTIVVVDHDMDFLLPLVRRLIVMSAGKKLADGNPDLVRQDQTVIDVYLGKNASHRVERLSSNDP